MANAALTLTINGTIAGRTINRTFSQIVDNIDVVISRLGQTVTDASVATHVATGGPYTPIAEQDCDIMLAINLDTRGVLQFGGATSGDDFYVFLEPGSFFIMQKAAAGGVVNMSTTATTSTCVSTEQFEVLRPFPYTTCAHFHVFGCFNYAS